MSLKNVLQDLSQDIPSHLFLILVPFMCCCSRLGPDCMCPMFLEAGSVRLQSGRCRAGPAPPHPPPVEGLGVTTRDSAGRKTRGPSDTERLVGRGFRSGIWWAGPWEGPREGSWRRPWGLDRWWRQGRACRAAYGVRGKRGAGWIHGPGAGWIHGPGG